MTLTQIPGVPYGPAPRTTAVTSALSWPPRLVVIHDTGNTASAADEAHYAATRTDAQANWTSCHAYIDTSGMLGSLPLPLQAWAAFSYANQHGWHLEMCGMNAGAPGAVPAITIATTARLAAQLCDLAGIPKVHLGPADVAAGKSGITGHWDITQGLHVGTHDDPGPTFDWSAFIAAVNSANGASMFNTQQEAALTHAADVIGSAALGGDTTWDKKPIQFMTWLKDIHDAIVGGVKLSDAAVAALAAALAAHPMPGTGSDPAAIEQALREILPTIRLSTAS
jgi:hypothetical protein